MEIRYETSFENSHIKIFAFEDDRQVGRVRVISEGVETALLVDLQATTDENEIKIGLVRKAEEYLQNKRVMVYGQRKDLELYEALGYGRCKNAWTYFRKEFDEKDFLPAGYKYENEFIEEDILHNKKEILKTNITYKTDYEDSNFDEINTLLTKAFWGREHDINRTKEAFSNSEYVVTAYDGTKLVGIARAVSDKKDYATILNVAVDPEYQGLSIGKNVVLKLSEKIEAKYICLNTHPGAVGFYNRIQEYRRNKYIFEKVIRNKDEKTKTSINRSAMFTPKGYRFPDEY